MNFSIFLIKAFSNLVRHQKQREYINVYFLKINTFDRLVLFTHGQVSATFKQNTVESVKSTKIKSKLQPLQLSS